MALFGAPIAHEDHAPRAVYAALHLQRELRRYAEGARLEHGLGFSVRMGLNSGEVVVGKIGDGLHGTAVYNLVRMRKLAAITTKWTSHGGNSETESHHLDCHEF